MRDGTVTVKLTSGQDVVDVDFEFTPTGSIGDFIFLDANGDGKQTSDKGISKVTVDHVWMMTPTMRLVQAPGQTQ